jgi:hypothetical protein
VKADLNLSVDEGILETKKMFPARSVVVHRNQRQHHKPVALK